MIVVIVNRGKVIYIDKGQNWVNKEWNNQNNFIVDKIVLKISNYSAFKHIFIKMERYKVR